MHLNLLVHHLGLQICLFNSSRKGPLLLVSSKMDNSNHQMVWHKLLRQPIKTIGNSYTSSKNNHENYQIIPKFLKLKITIQEWVWA